MRVSEITSMTRDQINRETFLPDTKNITVRTVPLSTSAYKVILELLADPMRPIDTNLLFYGDPSKDGKRRPYTQNKVWAKALNRANIEDFKFHDLRHEATSRFVEAGLSDQEVASINGHKSMQMLKRCTHLRSEDLVSKLTTI